MLREGRHPGTYLDRFLDFEHRNESRENDFYVFLIVTIFRNEKNVGQNKWDHIMVGEFGCQTWKNTLHHNSL